MAWHGSSAISTKMQNSGCGKLESNTPVDFIEMNDIHDYYTDCMTTQIIIQKLAKMLSNALRRVSFKFCLSITFQRNNYVLAKICESEL